MSAAHRQRLCGVSRTHVTSHELTFLFITPLSQNCLRHAANDLVVCHKHTSWWTHVMSHELTNTSRTHISFHHTSVTELFAAQRQRLLDTNHKHEPRTHKHTSCATNSHFVSSHICHRTICSTTPTTSRNQSQARPLLGRRSLAGSDCDRALLQKRPVILILIIGRRSLAGTPQTTQHKTKQNKQESNLNFLHTSRPHLL